MLQENPKRRRARQRPHSLRRPLAQTQSILSKAAAISSTLVDRNPETFPAECNIGYNCQGRDIIMSVEQVGLTLIVAIVTAFATSVLNNWFELRRRQSIWTRETDERSAYYRRQQLEHRLASIEGHIENVLRIHQPFDLLSLMADKEALEHLRAVMWASNTAYAISYAIGDGQLTAALNDLDRLMAKTQKLVVEERVSAEDSKWTDHLDQVLQVAGDAFHRADQLLEGVYAQGLRRR